MASSPIFSISDFKTAIGKPVRPNLFKAEIGGWQKNIALTDLMKKADTGYEVSDIKDFSFRCEKAEFPGRSVAT